MSLNQKYTWQDFLKDNPEHREKGTKRTNSDGKKAFEAAYKAFIKNYLAERDTKVEKLIEKSKSGRDAMVTKSKQLTKIGKKLQKTIVASKIGRADAAIARHLKFKEKNKTLQKNFK